MKVDIERNRSGRMEVSFRVQEPGETVYEYLGRQVEPCVFELSKRLGDRLFGFSDQHPEARAFNVSEDYEGLDDRFIGWTIQVSYEEPEGIWV
jgi:hypothetical protein